MFHPDRPLKCDRRVGPAALRRAGPPPNTVTAHGGPAIEANWSHPTVLSEYQVGWAVPTSVAGELVGTAHPTFLFREPLPPRSFERGAR